MKIEDMVEAIRAVLADTGNEEQACSSIEARLAMLRRAYLTNRTEFSEEQISFLKTVRFICSRLTRFIELQEELSDRIDLEEYNSAMRELKAMNEELRDFGVVRRVRKEIRQLVERRSEVLQQEEMRRGARLTDEILKLEENAGPCPKCKSDRLEIKQGKNGCFWGCRAFPCCWYARPLTAAELTHLVGNGRANLPASAEVQL